VEIIKGCYILGIKEFIIRTNRYFFTLRHLILFVCTLRCLGFADSPPCSSVFRQLLGFFTRDVLFVRSSCILSFHVLRGFPLVRFFPNHSVLASQICLVSLYGDMELISHMELKAPMCARSLESTLFLASHDVDVIGPELCCAECIVACLLGNATVISGFRFW
jgi:hypothetical protein